MTNEMREIMDQLKALEERSAGLSPLAETAEQPEIEAREKELNAIAEERKALEARKAEIEAEEAEGLLEDKIIILSGVVSKKRYTKTFFNTITIPPPD